ncbi:unnamed protein product [Trichobilharzia regenti]|nr:unnamed protein product [Trichobilharzia regenti]
MYCLLMLCNVDGKMTTKIRKTLLTLHNNVRRSVRNGLITGQPAARSLKLLKWNMNLEKSAQLSSDRCDLKFGSHDRRRVSPFNHVGQNRAGALSIER